MAGIDFSKIRGDSNNGQRGGFEEFVCQIARQLQLDGEFKRVEGSGGDGGVEAYWELNNGNKIGYQAKYWLKAGMIDWRQINRSVKQVLDTHPELNQYIIAISCDLTGKSGTQGKGKSGWEHWKTYKKKWESFALAKGMIVKFDVWSESELRNLTLEQNQPGMIKYFFNEDLLTKEWFNDKCETSIKDLGIRYQPNFHVDTDVSVQFNAYLQKPEILLNLKLEVESFKRKIFRNFQYIRGFNKDDKIKKISTVFENKTSELLEVIDKLGAASPYYEQQSEILKNFEAVTQSFTCFEEYISDHLQLLKKMSNIKKNESHNAKINDLHRISREIYMGSYKLSDYIKRFIKDHYNAKIFLVNGNFGTGKSHALGHLIEGEVVSNRPAVLLLGQQFDTSDIRKQTLQKLGLDLNLTFIEFLEALNSAAEAHSTIGFIAIDALNEGAGREIWKAHLSGLITEVSRYPLLKLIVSFRSEYQDMIIPEGLTGQSVTHSMSGFEESSVFDEACRVFMDEQGIQRPNSPFLPPAFRNPLFLSQLCKWLNDSGEKSIPVGLTGMRDLLKWYLKGAAKAVQTQYKISDTIIFEIEQGMQCLAERMAQKKTLYLNNKCAITVMKNAVQSTAPTGKTWLQTLIDVGALRVDPDPHGSGTSFDSKNEVVKFAFQGFEEYLIANELYKTYKDCSEDAFKEDDALRFLLGWEWIGVFIALGVIVAEEEKCEIVDFINTDRKSPFNTYHAARVFQRGLYWRSAAGITPRTTSLLRRLGDKLDREMIFFEITSQFFLSEDHPWNAENLHNDLTNSLSMAERDSFWTIFVNNEDSDEPKSIFQQADWLLKQKKALPVKTAKLAAIFLTWQLATTYISHRDKSTKALINLFSLNPEVIIGTLEKFDDVDDLYVKERLYTAVYGVCHFIDKAIVGDAALKIYKIIFADGNPPHHILIRDAAQGIIERAKFLNVLDVNIDMDKCTPPWNNPYPLAFHSNHDIDKLAVSLGDEHRILAHSCTTEYSRGVARYGDFGRYILEYSTNFFCQTPLSDPQPSQEERKLHHDGELIGNWVAHRAYNFGWNSDLFPDDTNSSQYRDKNTTERIGKKYQWIAMHELLGILADNYYLSDRYNEGSSDKFADIRDIPHCRKVDPTLIRSPKQERKECLDKTIPKMTIPNVEDGVAELKKWIKKDKVFNKGNIKLTTKDNNGVEWVLLHRSIYERTPINEDNRHLERLRPFVNFNSRITALLVKKIDKTKFIAAYKNVYKRSQRSPVGYPDEGWSSDKYLLELEWRWPDENVHPNNELKDVPYTVMVADFIISSGEDRGLPDGHSMKTLIPFIITQSNIEIDRETPNILRNQRGEVVFYNSQDHLSDYSGYSRSWLRKDVFDKFLDDNNLSCVWDVTSYSQYYFSDQLKEEKNNFSLLWCEQGKQKKMSQSVSF